MEPMTMRIIFLVLFSPTVFGMDLPDRDKLDTISIELDTLKSTLQGYDLKLMELDNVKTRLFSLENQVVELQQESNKLNMRIQQLEIKSKVNEQTEILGAPPKESTNTSRSQVSITMKTTKHHGQRKVQQSRQIPTERRIAFTAGVSAYRLSSLGVHQAVIFDRIVSNLGNAYHPHSGIFLAPVKGVYFFVVTLMVSARHTQTLEIVVDGTAVTDMYAGAAGMDDYMSTSRHWILEVNKSSEVWIRTTGQGEVVGYMNSGFSGFLLFELE